VTEPPPRPEARRRPPAGIAGTESRVCLEDGATVTRRRVGPVAWAVLEVLVAASAPTEDGALVATTNVRALAGELSLSKDTVAGALSRLIGAGLVERRAVRLSSRFAGSVYVVVEDVGLVLSCPVCPCPKVSDTITSDRSQPGSSSRTGHTVIGDKSSAVFEALRLFE
jgi:hypothetical protein